MKNAWIKHYTLVELWIGIMIWAVAIQLVLFFIPGDKAKAALGLWIGALAALLLAKHMEWSLDIALDMGEAGAKKRVWLDYMVRYFAMAILLATLAITAFADPIACFMGLLTIKLSAYIQPFTHRISEKVCGKEPFEREMVSPEEQDRLYGKKETQKDD